jgi:hypothetical protein
MGLLAVVAGLTFSGLAIAGHSGGGHGGGGHGGGGHGGTGHGNGHGGYGGHRGSGVGFYGYGWGGPYFGDPWFWGAYDTWPLYDEYYYSPQAVSPATSPVYIEQDAPAVLPQQGESSWYYCDDPPGYYPYVQNCPAGWQRVRPQLPPGRY